MKIRNFKLIFWVNWKLETCGFSFRCNFSFHIYFKLIKLGMSPEMSWTKSSKCTVHCEVGKKTVKIFTSHKHLLRSLNFLQTPQKVLLAYRKSFVQKLKMNFSWLLATDAESCESIKKLVETWTFPKRIIRSFSKIIFFVLLLVKVALMIVFPSKSKVPSQATIKFLRGEEKLMKSFSERKSCSKS